MINIHSIIGRIVLGKLIGLIFGILIILLLPAFGFPIYSMLGLGSLIMFMLMGVLIGFIGIFDRHPIFDFEMRWYFRSGLVGFVFMLMYILLSHDSLKVVMESSLISWTGLSSPFWALIDGTCIGLLMGWVETKFAGEGEDLPLS